MSELAATHQYVLCVSNKGNDLSVIKGKLYRVLPAEPNDRDHDLRVVDETGEDYLYDKSWFVPVTLSAAAIEKYEAA